MKMKTNTDSANDNRQKKISGLDKKDSLKLKEKSKQCLCLVECKFLSKKDQIIKFPVEKKYTC